MSNAGLQEELGRTELFGQKWPTDVQKPRPLNDEYLVGLNKALRRIFLIIIEEKGENNMFLVITTTE